MGTSIQMDIVLKFALKVDKAVITLITVLSPLQEVE